MSGNTRSRGGRKVSEILNSDRSGLGKILSQARRIDKLDKKLASILDSDLKDQIRVAALKENLVVLMTPSAAVATRVRMDRDAILRAFQAAGAKGVTQLQVRVAPMPETRTTSRQRRKLPDVGRKSLERFASDSGDSSIMALLDESSRKPDRD
jgi:hypothetical protein